MGREYIVIVEYTDGTELRKKVYALDGPDKLEQDFINRLKESGNWPRVKTIRIR